MGTKLLWTGLTFILAVIPALKAFGINASEVVVLVGAIFMFIGTLLIWMDK
jgi:hypothetical protein